MKIIFPLWAKKFFELSSDGILIGAWAVNFHVADPNQHRMSGDVDIVAAHPEQAAWLIAGLTGGTAAQSQGGSWCVLLDGIVIADVLAQRPMGEPPHQMIEGVRVIQKHALIADKELAAKNRAGTAKGYTDLADLCRLRGER